ncbi:MAG: hypothetical protein BWY15_01847 [Firmicutes bacterium ADurb.Bin193]|nr:MAG: hypothetical protein BWY15_01847 [Firmicutes bacterium ADurb.Bin193]
MEKYNKTIGRYGEDAAVRYLKRRGYRIIERNYTVQGGEIDIIAQKGVNTVFVEVKTRSGDGYGSPAEAVTYIKKQRMKKAATVFLQKEGDCFVRFDVVEVYGSFDGKKFKKEHINHIENAII